MSHFLPNLMVCIYFAAALCLLVYGINCYVMIGLYRRRRERAGERRKRMLDDLGDPMAYGRMPRVTTQIAVYNELNVAERVIRAVCAMRYPAGRHQVQVLDDSTDETRDEVDRVPHRLMVKRQVVGPGLCEASHELRRIRHRQVHVEEGLRQRGAERATHVGPHRQVADEMPVHYVKVQQIAAGIQRRPCLPPHL